MPYLSSCGAFLQSLRQNLWLIVAVFALGHFDFFGSLLLHRLVRHNFLNRERSETFSGWMLTQYSSLIVARQLGGMALCKITHHMCHSTHFIHYNALAALTCGQHLSARWPTPQRYSNLVLTQLSHLVDICYSFITLF